MHLYTTGNRKANDAQCTRLKICYKALAHVLPQSVPSHDGDHKAHLIPGPLGSHSVPKPTHHRSPGFACPCPRDSAMTHVVNVHI